MLSAVVSLVLGLCSPTLVTSAGASAPLRATRSGAPSHGGSLTVLEGTTFAGSWPGLNPTTDSSGGADQTEMDAIFGELFELGPGGKLIDDLATGYRFANGGKTVLITLRKGVKFSDGTPFDAQAVVYNWRHDLGANCTCKPTFNQKQMPVIKALGPLTVSITLQYVDASFVNTLQDNTFNWIYSPTAASRMSKQAFALKPVGAGPFVVAEDISSSMLVLKRNPLYWQKGLPYLSTLTFKSVSNDESALEAMEAGSGQAYEDMSTPQLVSAYKKRFEVTTEPSSAPYDIQVNTAIPPFNNLKARQAIYYATDAALLDEKLFHDTNPVGESFEAPEGLFYVKNVPGYLGYNLAKARQLVKQLGGLSFNLMTINVALAVDMDEALQTMYQAAGMKVTLKEYDLATLIGEITGGKWQAQLTTDGAYDPASGQGVCFVFCSTSVFSGVHDKHLDALLQAASATTNLAQRKMLYLKASEYMAQKAYGPNLFPLSVYNVVDRGVSAPGLTTDLPSAASVGPAILWQYARVSG